MQIFGKRDRGFGQSMRGPEILDFGENSGSLSWQSLLMRDPDNLHN